MGSLTPYLQYAFAKAAPSGWACRAEVPLVDKAATRRLGFEPRADLLMERADGSARIWVEFEISRADPVANHAKFATARFLEGGPGDEVFVSMVSRHVVSGRAALAAGTALAMRAMGIPAFQVDLLPDWDAACVKRLNAMPASALRELESIDAAGELRRVLEVGQVDVTRAGHRIHKADNPWTVGVNVREWNRQIATVEGMALWGRRAVRFYVLDPASGLFAPSKFCAFVPAPQGQGSGPRHDSLQPQPVTMDMALYAALGEDDTRFDGHIACQHLQSRLGYQLVVLNETPVGADLHRAFEAWHSPLQGLVPLRRPVSVLMPRARAG